MAKAQKLNSPTESGQYEDKYFDLPQPWRGNNWHFVLFTTSQGNKWCGHFREKESTNFHVVELENNTACIISGGHGYLIDIDKKEKIKDVNEERLLSIASDNLTSSFIISSYRDMSRIDKNFKEINIDLPIEADGINLKEINDRKLFLEIQEIGADMKTHNDYYLDLNDWIVKK